VNTTAQKNENIPISEKLAALVSATLEEVTETEKIYLFGSHAYGTPREDSDIDLLVITSKEIEDSGLFREAKIRCKVWNTTGDFDMLMESADIFNDRRLKYKLEKKVFNEGKILYARV
jgi:predicted nucleotidyltransferase